MNTEKQIISRGRRASAEQKGALLSYLEDNINFAHERFECDAGVNSHLQTWQELGTKLNAMGGAFKTAEQWKQYWRDFRRNVKSKAAEEKRLIEASGVNGMRKIRNLDEYERRAVSIMTVDVVDGDGISQERGFGNLRTVSYNELLNLNTSTQSHDREPCNAGIINTTPSTTNIAENNNSSERPRARAGERRLSLRRRRAAENESDLNKLLEIEKDKITLKRKIFEFHKTMENQKFQLEKEKTEALVTMSKSINLYFERNNL